MKIFRRHFFDCARRRLDELRREFGQDAISGAFQQPHPARHLASQRPAAQGLRDFFDLAFSCARIPQSVQQGGRPINHALNSGLRLRRDSAELPVSGLDDCEVRPETCWLNGTPVSCGRGGRLPRVPSWAVGEHHGTNCA